MVAVPSKVLMVPSLQFTLTWVIVAPPFPVAVIVSMIICPRKAVVLSSVKVTAGGTLATIPVTVADPELVAWVESPP